MTDYMDRERRTSVPQSVFARPDAQRLDGATRWLASAGILVPSGAGWSFLHQTFFDYCYARQFVDGGGSLSEAILAGDQGLYARPNSSRCLHTYAELERKFPGVRAREARSSRRPEPWGRPSTRTPTLRCPTRLGYEP